MQVRLNTVFYFVLAIGMLLYLKLFDGTSQYLDGSSIMYYALFSFCILTTVLINGKIKNIFLEMLIIIILIGYYLRIPILLCSGAPTTLARISVSSGLVNQKILELCYHYMALSLAIIIINPKIRKIGFQVDKQKANRILLLSFIMVFLNIATIEWLGYGLRGNGVGSLGNFISIIRVFNSSTAMLILVTYIIAAGKTLPNSHKYWAFALIIINTGYCCYIGSKGAVAIILSQVIIARLICYGPIVINSKDLIALIILFPIALGNFFIANIMRCYQRGIIGIDQVTNWLLDAGKYITDTLLSLSSRIGFFDYYAESSLNICYRPYISFSYYFKSIVDKLTPGFEVFNVPYASRMFQFARSGVLNETMISDQVTLFGEASVIFSYFSIIMFFVMIIFFKFLAKRKPSNSSFMNIFYQAIVFSAYFNWIYGFGFDMFFCLDLVYNFIFFFGVLWFCRLSFRRRVNSVGL